MPPTLLSTRQLDGIPRRGTGAVGRRLADGTGVLAYDEILSFVAGAGGGEPGLRTQRFLAETLAIYQQQPQARRSVLVLAPRTGQASPQQLRQVVTAARAAPWLRSVGTTDLIRSTATADRTARVVPPRQRPTASTPPSPLTAGTLDAVGTGRQRASDMASVMVDASDVATGWDRAFDEVASTRWRAAAPSTHRGVVRTDLEAVDRLSRLVAVRPSTVNFFATSGNLSLTVVNNLERPVRGVRLVVTPRRRLLFVRDQPDPLSLAAGGRTTVRVPVEAVAAGTVPVDAALTTPSGAPLGQAVGEPVRLKVNVRPTATWIFWVLGIVAGLVFVVGLLRSLRRGPRAKTAMPLPDDVPEPTGGDDD